MRKRMAPPNMAFEPYENCPLCKDRAPERRGCMGCATAKRRDEQKVRDEAEAHEYLEQHRLLTAHFDNPDEMATLKDVFHRSALERNFDASDITDTEVLDWLGSGAGLLIVLETEFIRRQQQDAISFGDPTHWTEEINLTEAQIRARVIERYRLKLANERGMKRTAEALQGRAGAGPGVEMELAQQKPAQERPRGDK